METKKKVQKTVDVKQKAIDFLIKIGFEQEREGFRHTSARDSRISTFIPTNLLEKMVTNEQQLEFLKTEAKNIVKQHES